MYKSPKIANDLFIKKTTMLVQKCNKKEAEPIFKIDLMVFCSILNVSGEKCIIFVFLKKCHKTKTNVIVCDMIVAEAEPAIPQSKIKMNNQSNMQLSKTDESIIDIDLRG